MTMLSEDVHGTWNGSGWFVVLRPGADRDERGLYEGPDESTAAEVAAWWEHRYGIKPETIRG